MSALRAIAEFGWAGRQKCPQLSDDQKEAIDEFEQRIAEHLLIAVPNCLLLHPRQLIPTQAEVDAIVLQELIDAENLPPVLILKSQGQLFIHDGHHRATRALLDDELVLAVIFSLD